MTWRGHCGKRVVSACALPSFDEGVEEGAAFPCNPNSAGYKRAYHVFPGVEGALGFDLLLQNFAGRWPVMQP